MCPMMLEVSPIGSTQMTLQLPKSIKQDKDAYELVRLWASNGKLVSVIDVGKFADMGVNEKDAWGKVMSDFMRHMAKGLSEKYQWDEDRTKTEILKAFLNEINKPSTKIS